jgi:lysophospholipase L1-like esterase
MTNGRALFVAVAALALSCSSPADQEATSPAGITSQSSSRLSRTPVYLALGDSVPFGWSDARADASAPSSFIGYPQYLAWALGRQLLDAACPSEASGSFLSASAPDDGCRAYKATHELHVRYEGTQLAYALEVVRTTPRLQLVTIQLGANDLQLLAKGCAGAAACIQAGLPATLQATATNVATAVGALRVAGYTGQVVVIDYYDPTTDPLQGALLQALDQALQEAASKAGADFLDLMAPFAAAARRAGGDPCATGLIAKVNGACEIHPSTLGHIYIAMLLGRALDLH